MRWSTLRSLVCDRFAPALQGRLDVHSAAYGDCSCGQAWTTLDGSVIANGQEPGSADRNGMHASQLLSFGAMIRQDA